MKIYPYLFMVFLCCNAFSQSHPGKQLKAAEKSVNDSIFIKHVTKELYVCTCKPDSANPSGKGKIYYQGKWEIKNDSNKAENHFCDERFLIQFDLSELPVDITIVEAKLRLVCAEFNGDNQGQLVYESISEPWSSDIGYRKKPNTLPESRVTTGWPEKNSYHYVDITDFVKSWYNKEIPNYGLMGFSINTETSNSAIFCSSKFSKESVRPCLIVIYQKNN